LEHLEKRRDLRDRRPAAIDRLELWFSTGRNIDGLWVGTMEDKPRPGLRRVEEALQLIKSHDTLHYSRVINNLERIWVRLLPGDLAHYDRSLKACVFDERYVVLETTTKRSACAESETSSPSFRGANHFRRTLRAV
jgi:hypothetical protein